MTKFKVDMYETKSLCIFWNR